MLISQHKEQEKDSIQYPIIQCIPTYEWVTIQELYNSPSMSRQVRLFANVSIPIRKCDFQRFYEEVCEKFEDNQCYQQLKAKVQTFIQNEQKIVSKDTDQAANCYLAFDIEKADDQPNFLVLQILQTKNISINNEGVYSINGIVSFMAGNKILGLQVDFCNFQKNFDIALHDEAFKYSKQIFRLRNKERVKVLNM